MQGTEVALESNAFFLAIEYIAILCCGMVGGLSAIRKGYDLFAILITAWLTALGGGIVRDVMLGAIPPVGIADKGFVLTALASGVLVALIHPEVDRLKWSMLTIDAIAVGLFAVNGTEKAMLYGTSGMTAVFMGMFTALAGGLIRDMLINEVPVVIRDKHWYAVPSAAGCVLTVFVCKGVEAGLVSYTMEIVCDVCIVVLVVAMRLLSVKFNIMLPGAMVRHHTYLPSETRHAAKGPGARPLPRGRGDGDRPDGAGDADGTRR
ncbi:trimeric intracellular cation channel family protein [Bifidobacterium phasiani]|uniref:TRIC cation channel family protein n=1 Tax=Bifidobacterium phasiani TaxID=2834431 RepID=A0ABS6WBT8_9BIFI|nr:TRIC cation channel family protein [Bifidobacterium phasiani]MBW3083534.1 TRIC cation channel family protein [Bifidobacterium phasiani]